MLPKNPIPTPIPTETGSNVEKINKITTVKELLQELNNEAELELC